jgi:hypothetical protein
MSETDGIDQWDPLTVWRAVVIDLETVRWSLSEEPDPEWIEAFRNARTDRSGSPEYLNAGSEPAISGRDIEWKVGPEDHLDANLRVHERVDIANGVYREVVAKRAAEGDRVAQEQRVRVAAIAEAQRRLDEANGIAP